MRHGETPHIQPEGPNMIDKELAFIAALNAAVSGECAFKIRTCLGERGESREEQIGEMLEDCDNSVDKYYATA